MKKNYLTLSLSIACVLLGMSCQNKQEPKKPLESLVEDFIQRVYPKMLEEPWVTGDTLCIYLNFTLPQHGLASETQNKPMAEVNVWGSLNWTFYPNAVPPPPPPPMPFDEKGEELSPEQVQILYEEAVKEWEHEDRKLIENDPYALSHKCKGYTLLGPILVIFNMDDDVPQECIDPFLKGITLQDLKLRYKANLLTINFEKAMKDNDNKFFDGEFQRKIYYHVDSLGHYNVLEKCGYLR